MSRFTVEVFGDINPEIFSDEYTQHELTGAYMSLYSIHAAQMERAGKYRSGQQTKESEILTQLTESTTKGVVSITDDTHWSPSEHRFERRPGWSSDAGFSSECDRLFDYEEDADFWDGLDE